MSPTEATPGCPSQPPFVDVEPQRAAVDPAAREFDRTPALRRGLKAVKAALRTSIGRGRRALDIALLQAAVRWAPLSSLYFLLFSGKFHREHRAVLAGRLRFNLETADPIETSAALRRGVHRLEKGLLMSPRRPIFGLDFIEETFSSYTRLLENTNRSASAAGELVWAHDVLEEYFNVTGSNPRIDRLRAQFRRLPPPDSCQTSRCVPYQRDLSEPSPVSYDALARLAVRRRSVRWFLPQRVPRHLLVKALEVAAQSPSACNRQPFVFRIFDEPELARRIGAIPAGTAGFAHNFAAVVVVVGRLRAYADERDRHVIYIDAALASMSFLLALETLGLGSCCINWPDIEPREREMDRVLDLEADERPVMLIAVGYPDREGMVAYSQKKPVELLGRFNFE